jgi:hypothetical protein
VLPSLLQPLKLVCLLPQQPLLLQVPPAAQPLRVWYELAPQQQHLGLQWQEWQQSRGCCQRPLRVVCCGCRWLPPAVLLPVLLLGQRRVLLLRALTWCELHVVQAVMMPQQWPPQN